MICFATDLFEFYIGKGIINTSSNSIAEVMLFINAFDVVQDKVWWHSEKFTFCNLLLQDFVRNKKPR